MLVGVDRLCWEGGSVRTAVEATCAWGGAIRKEKDGIRKRDWGGPGLSMRRLQYQNSGWLRARPLLLAELVPGKHFVWSGSAQLLARSPATIRSPCPINNE